MYKAKGFTLIEVIVVAAIVLVLGGAVLYEHNQIKTTPTPVVATASPSSSPTPNPTAGWSTYSDTSFGVSFSYPSTWTASKTSSGATFLSPEAVTAEKTGVENSQADSLTVNFYASSKDLPTSMGAASGADSLVDWLNSQKGSAAVQSFSEQSTSLTNYGSSPLYTATIGLPGYDFYLEISNKDFDFFNSGSTPLTDTDQNILQSIKVTQ